MKACHAVASHSRQTAAVRAARLRPSPYFAFISRPYSGLRPSCACVAYSTVAPVLTFPKETVLTDDFDLIVIGAGSGGVAASRAPRPMGRVLIAEADRAAHLRDARCVPKKLMMYGGRLLAGATRGRRFAWTGVRPLEMARWADARSANSIASKHLSHDAGERASNWRQGRASGCAEHGRGRLIASCVPPEC